MKWADRASKIGAMRPLADTFPEFKYKHVIDQPWWEPLDVIFEDKTWIIVTSCQYYNLEKAYINGAINMVLSYIRNSS